MGAQYTCLKCNNIAKYRNSVSFKAPKWPDEIPGEFKSYAGISCRGDNGEVIGISYTCFKHRLRIENIPKEGQLKCVRSEEGFRYK